MAKDVGAEWVVVGHSERRGKGESDEEVAAKAAFAAAFAAASASATAPSACLTMQAKASAVKAPTAKPPTSGLR